MRLFNDSHWWLFFSTLNLCTCLRIGGIGLRPLSLNIPTCFSSSSSFCSSASESVYYCTLFSGKLLFFLTGFWKVLCFPSRILLMRSGLKLLAITIFLTARMSLRKRICSFLFSLWLLFVWVLYCCLGALPLVFLLTSHRVFARLYCSCDWLFKQPLPYTLADMGHLKLHPIWRNSEYLIINLV